MELKKRGSKNMLQSWQCPVAKSRHVQANSQPKLKEESNYR